ncbi:MAG: hypothetical protein ABMB14_15905 [Myxococcota bacterium]
MADGRTNEFGLAPEVVFNSCAETVIVTFTTGLLPGSTCPAPSVSAWYRHQFDRLDFTVQAFGGAPRLFGAGVTASYRVVDQPRFTFAPEVGAGFLWAHVALPTSFALSDRLWWYVEPSVGIRRYEAVRLGTGLWWQGASGVALGAEVGGGFLNEPQVDVAVLVGFAF